MTERKLRSFWKHLTLDSFGLMALLLAVLAVLPFTAAAQELNKPITTIDDDVTAFAYAPDGRIVFSVRHMFHNKKYDLQRDDIWMLDTNGKRRRLLQGEKFTNGDKPFTYQVVSFTWSPNSRIIAVQLFTSTVNDEDARPEDAQALLFLDDSGRQLKPGGKDTLVPDAEHPLWLRDNSTLVYLTRGDNPQGLYSLQYLNISSGPSGKAFEGRTFLAASRISGSNSAIVIEQDNQLAGPPRLQKLELLAQEATELATLEMFTGGLVVSPSGTKVAYYLDKEVLEIRDLSDPRKVARLRIGLGVYEWSQDERRILLKRTIEKKSAELTWVDLPELKSYKSNRDIPILQPDAQFVLHGLTVREFGLAPNGKNLGVVLPGKHTLQIFNLSN